MVNAARPAYPPGPQGPHADDLFGRRIPDPYRALEAIDDPAVEAWVEAENAVTRGVIDAIPARATIEARYRTLMDYEKFQIPFRAGPRWFYFYNSGLQNQFALYVRDGEDGPPRLFLDPNAFSADGTVALGAAAFTESGRYLAYSTQEAGSDWQTWRVREVASGEDLSDVLRWSKFSGAAWYGEDGFFYAAYDPPQDGKLLAGSLSNQRVFFHRLGTPQGDDELIYERPDHPEWYLGVEVTTDQRYALAYERLGTDPNNGLHVRDLSVADGPWRQLFAVGDAAYGLIDNDGSTFYIETTADAPRGRIVARDVDRPGELRELIAESSDSIGGVRMIGDRFYVSYLKDARSVVRIFEKDGTPAGEVPLPGIGSAGPPYGKREDCVAYFTFSSFTTPETIYRYDVAANTATLHDRPKIAFDPSPYSTEQIFVRSKDGTQVPFFLTGRTGRPRDGSVPVLLYAYGGFNIPLTPAFSRGVALWLEMGGAYAVANLRGGGEYGETWHEAGMRERKQNVFDDLIAVAEHLIASGYTSPGRLAIQGASNGGLLMGAMLTQRPDLFGAVLCDVGVLDMVRFHRFTAGNGWVPEYGSAEESEASLASLLAYSPYHNVRPGVFPATLICTGDHDDRVFPAHSYKFAAALQAAQTGPAPILLRVDVRAGHGAGKPLEKVIAEVCDQFAFAAAALKFEPFGGET